MNDTRQQWGLSEVWWPQASYWKSTSTQQYHARVVALREQRGAKSWERMSERAREEQFCFLETVLPHTSRTRKGIVLQQRQFFLVRAVREKLSSEKYLWTEGVFLAESQYSWQCEHVLCLGAIDTSNKYVGTVCIWKQILWDFSHRLLVVWIRNRLGKKEIESIFSFLVFHATPQVPSVKYVYAVDYKSMIGGYRTLLVMNSVNPLLIPLRYLSHVWVTSQQV